MSRRGWFFMLAAIIATGILSRVVHTGWRISDKYLGDALYAAMVYAMLRLVWMGAPAIRVALAAMAAMIAIELFQLTGIAAHMLESPLLAVRICARLMGTSFSAVDLLIYAIGISGICLVDLAECR